MAVPCLRTDSPRETAREYRPLSLLAYYRGKFDRGARHALPHRIDRLVPDGGKMAMERDFDRLWRALTDAIWLQREHHARNHPQYDWNKHVGLHQARTWLRRERAAEQRRLAA